MEDQSKLTTGAHDDGTLPTPHFDDEATLQSARPVVPFHELAPRHPRRRLYFGAGLVIAMLVVLAGGIFYARMEDTPELRTETPPAVAAQEELVTATDAPAETPEEAPVSVETPPSSAEKSVRKIASPPRSPVRVAEKSISPPTPRLRREPAGHPQTSDDLFRIQEIFEGSLRP